MIADSGANSVAGRDAPESIGRLAGGWRETVAVLAGSAVLAIVFTFPLAFHLGSVGRIDNGDGQFSIWNVAWVARALVADPRHVLDANIFYPHRGTLAYSETNLGAGALAVPAYWATQNPFAAHNFVLLISFVLSAAGMYYLARYLSGDRTAAAAAAVVFAFSPYVLGHLPHIQLLMTAGLPFGMLAFHRAVDRATIARGAVLGGVMGLQTFFCGYYAVFLMLLVGYGVVVMAMARRLWGDRRFWAAMVTAAAVAIAVASPLAGAYLIHQRTTGFVRSLQSAREFSASWRDYLASGAYAHRPLLALVGHGKTADLLFPGFAACGFGAAGALAGWRASGRLRESVILYGSVALLAAWLSFGPAAGAYSVLYAVVPAFTLMRAPSRFGLLVGLGVAVLASIGMAAWGSRHEDTPRRHEDTKIAWVKIALVVAAAVELLSPIRFPPVKPADPGYQVLASLPGGPVLELPVYSRQFGFVRESYMLNSTIHWKPLIDAYSDYIPDDFTANLTAYGSFPSREAFAALKPLGARYAVFHPDAYDPTARTMLTEHLKEFAPYLQERYAGARLWVYEIVGFPDPTSVSSVSSVVDLFFTDAR